MGAVNLIAKIRYRRAIQVRGKPGLGQDVVTFGWSNRIGELMQRLSPLNRKVGSIKNWGLCKTGPMTCQ